MATSDKARTPCQACGKDRGTVYVKYEGGALHTERATVWEPDDKREEAQDNVQKSD